MLDMPQGAAGRGKTWQQSKQPRENTIRSKSHTKNEHHGQPENETVKFHGSNSCRSRSASLGPARCVYRG